MTEKDIENLIARHPEKFFPNENFRVVGQQISLGKCRADIILKDKHDRTIIVEVKKGILSRDAAGQIIEYYGLLKEQKPDEIIELILCANIVPSERKVFLERVGIECKELGVSFITNLASQCGYHFLDEEKPSHSSKDILHKPTPKVPMEHKFCLSQHAKVWVFQANPLRYDILNALADPKLKRLKWQVNQYKSEIHKGDLALIWMSGKESGIYAIAEVMDEPCYSKDLPEEEIYWMDDKDKGNVTFNVVVEIKQDLTNRPIFRQQLKSILVLKEMAILKQAQGTNFPVKNEEWGEIRDLIG